MATTRHRSVRRASLAAASLALLASQTAACGEQRERDMCTAYAQMVSTLQPVAAADPTAATADEAEAAVEGVLDSVRQLRATTDGRYADAVDRLEAALDDLAVTLRSIDDDADYATWQPLVSDSIDDARAAAAEVDELMEPVCSPGS